MSKLNFPQKMPRKTAAVRPKRLVLATKSAVNAKNHQKGEIHEIKFLGFRR
jgi:hypothetical protein